VSPPPAPSADEVLAAGLPLASPQAPAGPEVDFPLAPSAPGEPTVDESSGAEVQVAPLLGQGPPILGELPPVVGGEEAAAGAESGAERASPEPPLVRPRPPGVPRAGLGEPMASLPATATSWDLTRMSRAEQLRASRALIQ